MSEVVGYDGQGAPLYGHQFAAEPDAGDVETLRVMVTVDTDDLRRWAAKHADAGNHGVAHVLYTAASDGESLTAQAIAQAKDEERAAWSSWLDGWLSAVGPSGPTIDGVARALREGPRPFGRAAQEDHS